MEINSNGKVKEVVFTVITRRKSVNFVIQFSQPPASGSLYMGGCQMPCSSQTQSLGLHFLCADNPFAVLPSDFAKVGRREESTICSVCHDPMPHLAAVLQGCFHVFCEGCVLNLQEGSKRCPQCNKNFRTYKPVHFQTCFQFSSVLYKVKISIVKGIFLVSITMFLDLVH